MIAMKFGGTSVGTADRIAEVARLVAAVPGPRAVVVSAMGGTTDQLLELGALAERGALDEALALHGRIAARHRAVVDDDETGAAIEALLAELEGLVRGVCLLRETTPRTRALLVSFGERLSVHLAARALRRIGVAAFASDARDYVRTDDRYDEGTVDLPVTREQLRAALLPEIEAGRVPVVTGFIGSTAAGVTTTLGRGGSDYSGALVGACLDADEVWIWTDVDGILTADPRLVSEARTLERVSYREAAEMSYFGAKVLHPRTMGPCAERGIPIRIRSTFHPEHPGTVVGTDTVAVPEGVKTVTSIEGMALVTLEGRGMAGIPGVARRIFEATEAADTNVVMISQASSEQSVSLVVRASEAGRLLPLLAQRFRLELAEGTIDPIRVDRDVAIVSIIGEGMSGRAGVSGRLFGALGRGGVNVLAIAQGAAERSISVAVRAGDARRAVRLVHTAFGLTRVVHLVVLGAGRVGRTLLRQLAETRALHARREVEFRVIAVATGSRFLTAHGGLDPATAADRVASGDPRPDDAALVASIAAEQLTDVVLVDLTAAPTAGLHLLALRAGWHVVTANKLPLAGDLATYRAMVEARDAARVRYGYEATFGAGLPVLHALKELVWTGDRVDNVSGCFSGTLGFVCTRLQEGAGLSQAVRDAAEAGYTEPDPREDLSGRDVARKALIVARAMGMRLEPEQVALEPMVPGLDEGLDAALAAHEGPLRERIAAAAARGEVLRYVAEITPDAVRVGLREVPATGALGSLAGPDNALVFRTARYDTWPLVIRGPGAGAEVTAAGVLGDILKIALGGQG